MTVRELAIIPWRFGKSYFDQEKAINWNPFVKYLAGGLHVTFTFPVHF